MSSFPELIHEEFSDIADQLREGENSVQDFKHRINDPVKISRSIVAFANTKGGSLWIGVDDSGRVIGAQVKSEFYHAIEVLEQFCRPQPEVSFHVYDNEVGEVLEIRIEEGTQKPYACSDGRGNWNVYIRVNDRCKKIGN